MGPPHWTPDLKRRRVVRPMVRNESVVLSDVPFELANSAQRNYVAVGTYAVATREKPENPVRTYLNNKKNDGESSSKNRGTPAPQQSALQQADQSAAEDDTSPELDENEDPVQRGELPATREVDAYKQLQDDLKDCIYRGKFDIVRAGFSILMFEVEHGDANEDFLKRLAENLSSKFKTVTKPSLKLLKSMTEEEQRFSKYFGDYFKDLMVMHDLEVNEKRSKMDKSYFKSIYLLYFTDQTVPEPPTIEDEDYELNMPEILDWKPCMKGGAFSLLTSFIRHYFTWSVKDRKKLKRATYCRVIDIDQRNKKTGRKSNEENAENEEALEQFPMELVDYLQELIDIIFLFHICNEPIENIEPRFLNAIGLDYDEQVKYMTNLCVLRNEWDKTFFAEEVQIQLKHLRNSEWSPKLKRMVRYK